jgi:dephospho-CoA kinase
MILGLTGGFGCGKSSVLAFFRDAGWETCNTDEICAQLYQEQNPVLIKQLRQRWQERVFDTSGEVNKGAVAGIIFNDNNELEWLCSILHPLIADETHKLIELYAGKDLMIEVPLLFEAEWEDMFDYTVCVWADAGIREKRLLKKGFSVDEIKNRNSKQMPDNVKLENADFGLINNGDMEFLEKQCKKLIKHLKGAE